MTDTPDREPTQRTFLWTGLRTKVSETKWMNTGMRALNVSYNDGTHSVALITHDDKDRRQTSIGIHQSTEITIDSDDDLAATINLRASDGTPVGINLFGITLEQIADAIASAIAQKHEQAQEASA
jgi:hypothetical protein